MQRLLCAVVLSRSGRYPDHGNSPQPVDLAIGSAGNITPRYTSCNQKSIGAWVLVLYWASIPAINKLSRGKWCGQKLSPEPIPSGLCFPLPCLTLSQVVWGTVPVRQVRQPLAGVLQAAGCLALRPSRI